MIERHTLTLRSENTDDKLFVYVEKGNVVLSLNEQKKFILTREEVLRLGNRLLQLSNIVNTD